MSEGKGQWKCALCEKENNDTEKSCSCGFARAQNYQEHFFLSRIPDCELENFSDKIQSILIQIHNRKVGKGELKAISDCRIEVSEYISVVFELAKAKRELKKWNESIKYIDKILDIDNKNAEAWNLKGIVCVESGREEPAEEALKKALENAGDNYSTLVNLGIVQKKLKKWKESEMSFDRAIAVDSERHIAWNEKGALLCEMEKWDKALGCFAAAEKYSKFDKKINAIQWSSLGYVFKKLDKLSDSLFCYKKAAEADPQKPQYYNRVGETALRLHKFNESTAAFKKAVELNPQYAQAWNGLGNIYENLDDLDNALKYYEESLRLDPMNEMYKEDVVIAKEQLNKKRKEKK